eukprot:5868530-Prymnesium_polylepis.1
MGRGPVSRMYVPATGAGEPSLLQTGLQGSSFIAIGTSRSTASITASRHRVDAAPVTVPTVSQRTAFGQVTPQSGAMRLWVAVSSLGSMSC